MYKFLAKNFPINPGVYIYKNNRGEIIYIGKAKNLKKRISQYFNNKHINSPKTQVLVKNIQEVDYIIVDNEVEALLLENKLIKKHKPKYNIDLKDNKTYPYIKITDEKIPKILSTRIVTKKGTYFGPYSDGKLKVDLIKICVKIFGLITKGTYSSKSHLNYEINLAPARTENEVNIEKYLLQVKEAKNFLKGNTKKILNKLNKDMKKASIEEKYEIALEKKQQIEIIKNIEQQKVDLLKKFDQDIVVIVNRKENSLIQILNISKGVIIGKKEYRFDYYDEELLGEFIKIYYSKNSVPKEILINKEINDKNIEKYLSNFRGGKVSIIKPQRGEKLSLVKLGEKNANINLGDENVLVEIQNKLKLPKLPKTIECFDISNLGTEHVVAGMTQFIDGVANKKGYRKFEIKSFSGRQDDFAAMKEVIYRRYKKLKISGQSETSSDSINDLKNTSSKMPDLIIIDGGKGQLGVAVSSLKSLGLSIPIIGLAKREEEIFVLGLPKPLIFDKNSKMMLLIRHIRNSTHNLVINYNRKKRQMKFKKETE